MSLRIRMNSTEVKIKVANDNLVLESKTKINYRVPSGDELTKVIPNVGITPDLVIEVFTDQEIIVSVDGKSMISVYEKDGELTADTYVNNMQFEINQEMLKVPDDFVENVK